MTYRRPTSAIWTAVIWFSVSVPVLSELIAEVEPSVSVDCNRFMIAPTRASACVPEARIAVTTAGRFSGMAPTAKATAAVKTTVNLSPRTRFKTIDTTKAIPAIHRICRVSLSSWRVSGVLAACSACSIPEMWPTSVAIPVAVTTNSPEPRVTLVFMYTMSARSPSGVPVTSTGSVPLATGRLSPVSADSATSSVAARSSRPSAGTTSPASIETMSPGTSCSAAISRSWLSRMTLALRIIIFCRAVTAAAAFPSCCRPRTALKSVSRIRTMPVSHSCRPRLTRPAPSRTSCIRSAYWRTNARHRGSVLPASNALSPNRSARAAASAEVRPCCPSTCSACSTWSVRSVCQIGPSSPGASADTGAPVGTVTCPPRASAVSRHGAGRGHMTALGQVDGDAEEQRAGGQEVRGPVDPEAVTGVAGVDDEQDREHQGQHGNDHVPDKARRVHGLVIYPPPLQLRERGEAVGDGGGDAGHQDQGGEHGRAARADVVDGHRDRGERGGGDDAEGGDLALVHTLEPFREQAVLGGGQRHLGADHGPAGQRAEPGDDHRQGHHVAGPGAAEDGVGHVGERRPRLG